MQASGSRCIRMAPVITDACVHCLSSLRSFDVGQLVLDSLAQCRVGVVEIAISQALTRLAVFPEKPAAIWGELHVTIKTMERPTDSPMRATSS